MGEVVSVEVLPVQVDGKTRYGVMEIRRGPAGIGFVVYYGHESRGGNQHDWGTTPDEARSMRVMAVSLLLLMTSRPPRS